MADEKSNGAETEAEPKKPTCFVVSPIGAAGSPERKHANVTLRFIIEPVLEKCGFQRALRADTLGEVGIISRQIISQLLNADLVIADLTFHNPNVYYELAIRHGTGKPFVQLHTRGQTLPFDVAQQRTIFFDRTDLEDVEDCKAELERQVKAAMASTGPMDTPIGQTLDYERLRSGGTVEQALAKLTDQVAAMNGQPARQGSSGMALGRKPIFGLEPLHDDEPAIVLQAGMSDSELEHLIHQRFNRIIRPSKGKVILPVTTIQEAIVACRSAELVRGPLTTADVDALLRGLLNDLLTMPDYKLNA